MRYPLALQVGTQQLRFLDGDRSHQDRASLGVQVLNFLDDRPEFFAFCAINYIRMLLPFERTVGGNHHHIQLIDLVKFGRFRIRRAGHAGQLFVHAKIVLKGDRRQRLVFVGNLEVFLGFQRLV